jgi:hypothetical protein
MKKSIRTLGALTACLLILAGCGGGGGGSGSSGTPPPVVSTNTFPMQGLKNRVVAGTTENFTVEDACNGTATITSAVPVADTFEGIQGYSAAQTATAKFSNCAPSTTTVSVTNHYDANYTLIGTSSTSGEYIVYATAPPALPATAKVGDKGTIVTLDKYTNSSKQFRSGKRVVGYEIEPDTATTAIFDLITQDYDINDVATITEHSLYRMAADGSLTLLYNDVQYSPPNARHLLYTQVP